MSSARPSHLSAMTTSRHCFDAVLLECGAGISQCFVIDDDEAFLWTFLRTNCITCLRVCSVSFRGSLCFSYSEQTLRKEEHSHPGFMDRNHIPACSIDDGYIWLVAHFRI